MKRFLQYLPGLIALAFLSACNDPVSDAQARPGGHHDAGVLAGKAESGIYMNATLATLGSFEWDAAPLTNKAADVLIAIPLQLKKHEITKAEAQARLNGADRAHDLVQQALTACAQNPKTGHCTGDEAKARKLLDQAKGELGIIDRQ